MPEEKIFFPLRDGPLTNHDPTEQARKEVDTSQVFGKLSDDLAPTPEDVVFEREPESVTVGNHGDSRDIKDLIALGRRFPEQISHLAQKVEDLSSDSWGRFEELRLEIEYCDEKTSFAH